MRFIRAATFMVTFTLLLQMVRSRFQDDRDVKENIVCRCETSFEVLYTSRGPDRRELDELLENDDQEDSDTIIYFLHIFNP